MLRWGISFLGLVALLILAGCSSSRVAWEHQPMGGPVDADMELDRTAGTGEYLGYPNYPQHQPW